MVHYWIQIHDEVDHRLFDSPVYPTNAGTLYRKHQQSDKEWQMEELKYAGSIIEVARGLNRNARQCIRRHSGPGHAANSYSAGRNNLAKLRDPKNSIDESITGNFELEREKVAAANFPQYRADWSNAIEQ